MTLGRAAAAEAVGTALLLAIVVGSGIMGERLAQGNMAVALLANSIATGASLYALIVILGPVSGAHFNPVVSGVSVWDGRLSGWHGVVYVLAQISGALRCCCSARDIWTADLSDFSAESTDTGRGPWRIHRDIRPYAGYLAGTKVSRRGDSDGSCSFHYECLLVHLLYIVCESCRDVCTRNDRHFAGISPHSVPLFVGGQLIGGAAATLFSRWLLGGKIATLP
jgi:glycerol uptake facilitator-like aquaporin